MQSNFTIETDKLRLIYSLLFFAGSIFAVIVSIRVLQQDEEMKTDDKCDMKYQIQKLEKQLQKLKDSI